jgi:hypothetical protein
MCVISQIGTLSQLFLADSWKTESTFSRDGRNLEDGHETIPGCCNYHGRQLLFCCQVADERQAPGLRSAEPAIAGLLDATTVSVPLQEVCGSAQR